MCIKQPIYVINKNYFYSDFRVVSSPDDDCTTALQSNPTSLSRRLNLNRSTSEVHRVSTSVAQKVNSFQNTSCKTYYKC